jgi:hypothetical protein
MVLPPLYFFGWITLVTLKHYKNSLLKNDLLTYLFLPQGLLFAKPLRESPTVLLIRGPKKGFRSWKAKILATTKLLFPAVLLKLSTYILFKD